MTNHKKARSGKRAEDSLAACSLSLNYTPKLNAQDAILFDQAKRRGYLLSRWGQVRLWYAYFSYCREHKLPFVFVALRNGVADVELDMEHLAGYEKLVTWGIFQSYPAGLRVGETFSRRLPIGEAARLADTLTGFYHTAGGGQ